MNKGRLRNLLLMLADALCVAVCWLVSVLLYHSLGGDYDPIVYLRFWPVIPAYLLLNALFRIYHGSVIYPSAPPPQVEEFRRLVGSALLLHLGIIAALALMHQTTKGYSRAVIIISGFLVAITAQTARRIMRTVMLRLHIGQIPAVIAGAGKASVRLVKALNDDGYSGIEPVGYFDDADCGDCQVPRWGNLREVVKVCQKRDIKLMFACVDERAFRCMLAELTEWFTYIEYFPTAEVFPIFGSRAVSFGGIGGLEMVNQDRMRELRLEKWLLDKILSLIAFVLASPILLVIAVLVRLTSAGPVFFRHDRLGRYGQKIRIWKFRTMYVDADARFKRLLEENPAAAEEWKRKFKLKNDPRVTPFGRLLRKTSLDELPQIFNVLGGSMALVGPRPIVKDERKYYGSAYTVLSSVKPGVTGLWQVSGRSDTDYARRVALDVYYVLNWSPWLDLWILMRTVGAVLFMQGSR